MIRKPRRRLLLILCAGVAILSATFAGQAGETRSYHVDYLGPVLDDPLIQQGKETYVVAGCAYCHGLYLEPLGEAADLMHSPLVGHDQNGNLIAPVLRAGIPVTTSMSPMPQYSDLSDQQIAAIVRWIHYARQRGRYKELLDAEIGRGDAAAGKTYFEENCASCHSVKTDLAGIGRVYNRKELRAQILDPAKLQQKRSFRIEARKDPKNAARETHDRLLENYSADDIANLVGYLEGAR